MTTSEEKSKTKKSEVPFTEYVQMTKAQQISRGVKERRKKRGQG